jgi:hypothetical protein
VGPLPDLSRRGDTHLERIGPGRQAGPFLLVHAACSGTYAGTVVRVLCIILAIASISLLAATTRHPQDGAHADLRVEILPDRVVEHIAMNLVFLDEFAPVSRERPDDLDAVELRQVAEALATAMAERAPVAVDGISVPPRIENLRLAAVDASLLPLFPRSGMRGMRRVEFEAVYPLKQPPQRVAIGWRVFPEDLLSTPATPRFIVLAAELEGDGRREGFELSKGHPTHEWRAPSGKPGDELAAVPAPPSAPLRASATPFWLGAGAALLVGIVLALRARGARRWLAAVPAIAGVALAVVAATPAPPPHLPTAAEARAVFAPLHANLYRALDYTREGDIYDVLAHSVDGPMLESLYRQMQRSLAIEEAGGAMGRVVAVRPLEVDIEAIQALPAPDGLTTRAQFEAVTRWQVHGSVSHWGHRHDRTNEYRARYRVQATPEGWRIVGEELLDERRLDTPPAELPPDGDDVL